jgi:hypothetical protein
MTATAPQRGTCRVEVYFDPACPVSWLVTRWLLEVQPHRNLDLVLHVTSLMLVNAGRALDADYHALLARSPAAARVFLAVTELGGRSVLGDFYEAFGTAMFTADNDAVVHAPRRQPEEWALAVRRALDIALVETGLPPPWPTPQILSGTTRRSRPTLSRQHVGSARPSARPCSTSTMQGSSARSSPRCHVERTRSRCSTPCGIW